MNTSAAFQPRYVEINGYMLSDTLTTFGHETDDDEDDDEKE